MSVQEENLLQVCHEKRPEPDILGGRKVKEVINCTGWDLDSEDDDIAGRGDGEEEVGQVNYPGVGQGY